MFLLFDETYLFRKIVNQNIFDLCFYKKVAKYISQNVKSIYATKFHIATYSMEYRTIRISSDSLSWVTNAFTKSKTEETQHRFKMTLKIFQEKLLLMSRFSVVYKFQYLYAKML